ncbi:hypothetical protein [Kitasatospora sp. NPDC001683]
MVDFHELSNADFGSLDAAATAWTTVAQKLKSMDDDWNTTVVGQVDSECWVGNAADQARPGLKRTADQLSAAVTEANALASIFTDAATEFKAAKAKLDKAVADAQAAKLTVTADGTVNWPPPDTATRHDRDALDEYQKEWGGKADAAHQAIVAAIAEATAADERIAYALNSDSGTDKDHSFNANAIGGGPEADGKRASLLAAKGGDISDTELTELNSLLASHQNDPKFATTFYQDLGPDGLIKSWNSMVGDPAHYRDPNDPRWKAYQDLQRNLGLNLATATRQSNQPHLSDDWAAALRKAGAQPVWDKPMRPTGFDYQPYGYQVLSGILMTGNYDPHFLDPIAQHVTQLDTNRDKYWPAPPQAVADRVHGFNLLGGTDGGLGFQPTTAVLTALGHSPAAANQFFSEQPTAYNEDGTVNPSGKPKPADYFTYYTHDKEWLPDTNSMRDMNALDQSKHAGPTALGHALEAATSGHPYDQPADVPPKPHTPEQAALAERVLDTFGTHGGNGTLDDIKGDGKFAPLRGSLGHIAADYIGDVQRAASGANDLPVNGSAANLDGSKIQGLLDALGRDPQSYGSITNANQAYTSALIRGALDSGQTDFSRLQADINHIAQNGSVVTGTLAEARVDEVHTQHHASDKAYNDAVAENVGFAKDVFNQTIGKVTDKVPFGSDLSGMLVDDVTNNIIAANSRDTTADGEQDARVYVQQAKQSSMDAVSQAVRDASLQTSVDYADVQRLAAGAQDASKTGFIDGLSTNMATQVRG